MESHELAIEVCGALKQITHLVRTRGELLAKYCDTTDCFSIGYADSHEMMFFIDDISMSAFGAGDIIITNGTYPSVKIIYSGMPIPERLKEVVDRTDLAYAILRIRNYLFELVKNEIQKTN